MTWHIERREHPTAYVCEDCGGEGRVHDLPDEVCPQCNGARLYPDRGCECNGTGRVVAYWSDLANGTYADTCPTCDGLGVVT